MKTANSIISVLLGCLCYLLLVPSSVSATSSTQSPSAQLSQEAQTGVDSRAKALRAYLSRFDSPLAENAQDFINVADEYQLDWKLLPAIAGVESTFGKAIPAYSYNAWGWGVYGDHVIRFPSFAEGIRTIGKGLRENYVNKGATNVYQIGRIYAASPTWAERVDRYMNNIEFYTLNTPEHALSLAL